MRGTFPGRFDVGSWAAPLQACSPYNELARNPACCVLMLPGVDRPRPGGPSNFGGTRCTFGNCQLLIFVCSNTVPT